LLDTIEPSLDVERTSGVGVERRHLLLVAENIRRPITMDGRPKTMGTMTISGAITDASSTANDSMV
jgi:hypothetical protein